MHLTDTISFERLFSLLPVPAVVLLPDGPHFTVLDVNKAYLDIAGAFRDEALGKGFSDAFPGNPYRDDRHMLDLLEQTVRTGTETRSPAREYSFSHLLPERDRVFLSAVNTPVTGESGEVAYILRTLRDMTDVVETRRSEGKVIENLVKSERLLNETQRLAEIGSWEVDLMENRLFWSSALKKIYEVPDDYQPTMAESIQFFEEGKNRDTITAVVTRTMEAGEFFDLELPIMTARGNQRWLRITGKVEMADGKGRRIYGATQDITERRRAQAYVEESRNKLNSLIQTVDGVVWEADAETYRCTFISDRVEEILGFSSRQWLEQADFWEQHIYEQDRARIIRYCHEQTELGNNFEVDYRMVNDGGGIVWVRDRVTIISEKDRPRWIRGVLMNITVAKRIAEIEHVEKTVLELNSKKEVPVEKVLATYLEGIESLFPGMRCSIVRVAGGQMSPWVSVSLPKTYNARICNLPIGPHSGSCGQAAYSKMRCIVTDIEHDAHWSGAAALALRHNLRACWSEPIMDSSNQVIATFGIYYDEVKAPGADELRVIDRASALLKIILENRMQSEALKEATSLMMQGQDLAHFGTWQWDIITNKVSWSAALYAIYGQQEEGFNASFEGYLELVHPDDRGRVYRLIARVLKQRKDLAFEERIIRPSGEVRYLKSWARLKTDEHGQPLKMVGACMDITEAKKIQEDLRASEVRLRTLVESQTNYVIRLDLSGRYLYANNKYVRDFGWLFGYKEPLGQSAFITVTPADHEKVADASRRCREHPNEIVHLEIDKKRQDGGTQPTFWHFICLTDAAGAPSELQCIGIDVSDRKRTEAELKLTTERYEYVNKATQDAIYDWNIETDHIAWGDGFSRQFGYTLDDAPYPLSRWASLLHPDDVASIEASLHAALQAREVKTWTGEYRLRRADGDYAYVEEKGYILRDSNGRALRIIGAVRNISERKRSESKLRELHEELQASLKVLAASNAELEQFAYVASHDLQEPLRMITGFLTQLESKYSDGLDDKARQYIFFAVDGARRMRQIILDLLDYSRVGRAERITEEVDLNQLVGEEVLALVRSRIEETDAVIELAPLPTIFTFRAPLRQVFQNLIDNGLKYRQQGVAPQVRIGARELPSCWEFSVADNGIGIEQEYFEKIFVIFQRLHGRDEYAGSGLGLAITKKIVESLGGSIRVESVPGKGSTFYFTIAKA